MFQARQPPRCPEYISLVVKVSQEQEEQEEQKKQYYTPWKNQNT